MDKFARYYAYFLLFVTAVPALMRLMVPGRVAVLTSERMANPKTRARYRWIGIASVVLSTGAAVAYFIFWRHQVWLGLAAVVGLLSGAEMMGNTSDPAPASLTRQNILFGVLYAAAAVATYFLLLR